MNRKEIIKADLCGRLIHKPWCKWSEQEYRFRIAGICPSELEENKVIAIDSAYDEYYLDEIKPILFSSLTQPITVAGYNDGLAFVPIVELYKATGHDLNLHKKEVSFKNTTFDVRGEGSELFVNGRMVFSADRYINYEGLYPINFSTKNGQYITNHWKLYDLLNQWHVNYRLLPGEFIPATNEYA